MKKFYTFMLSLAVAGSAFAFSPIASPKKDLNKISNPSASVEKVATNATITSFSDAVKKAPAKEVTEATGLAGTYTMDLSYKASSGSIVETNTSFTIAPTSDPEVVTISDFLADFFGPTNDLTAHLEQVNLKIDDAGNTEPFTVVSIDLVQTLFVDVDMDDKTPVDIKLYLYGPLAGDGNNYVFSGDNIKFIVINGMLVSYYTNMMLWAGFESSLDGKLYGYPAFMGPDAGAEDLTAIKANAFAAGTEYLSDEETAPINYALIYQLDESETQTAIYLKGLMGFNSVTEWVVDKETMTATATNNILGQQTIKFKKYDVLLMDENATENFTAVGKLSTNDENKTVMTFEAALYATIPDQGWVAKYDPGFTITFDTNLFPGNTGGITNAIMDNSNAPVEYFNLQGIKVDAPAAGTIVIRRQGNDVKKVIM